MLQRNGQDGGGLPLAMGSEGTAANGLAGLDASAAATIQELVKVTECSWDLASQALQASGNDAQRCDTCVRTLAQA